jgi:benzoate/toluate 1,2-dioxygenase reductase subunit
MLDKIAAAGGSPHPIHLIYGVNTDRDVVETERLEACARLIPNFSFAVVVVDADGAWPRKGYVTITSSLPTSTTAKWTSTSAARRRWSRRWPSTCATSM